MNTFLVKFLLCNLSYNKMYSMIMRENNKIFFFIAHDLEKYIHHMMNQQTNSVIFLATKEKEHCGTQLGEEKKTHRCNGQESEI